ncbi:MAG: hypothetical protein HOA57_01365 [Candidatus Magasanikbacteria bacterium]|jgi:hypothetical protein|nr:hypothetical protein [Candidatus Magasanikbacteria bacterium]MBT4315207.1 hypothetical protein [Candidatus Magasanikbacteria bacterium]MBT4547247.1 hypothetical protein [Candidatus Magasanikbacteria bacterium]MBT6819014.1 hypothetical protein [Candidatus Magasanikbacteria bacterium]
MPEDKKSQVGAREFKTVCPKCNSSQVFKVVECHVIARGSRCDVFGVCSNCKKGTRPAELSRMTTACPKKDAGDCKYNLEQPDEGDEGGFFSRLFGRKR